MPGGPQVLGLLEEMLDSGKTPEGACRDCPELLPEVRQRWQQFQLIDAQLRTFLPVGQCQPKVTDFGLVSSFSYENAFKKAAARLDERDLRRLLEHPLAAGRLQQPLLDTLAGMKNRPFRNTWDYLDCTESNGKGTDEPSPATNR
jgi:hypothetical protein